MTAPRISHIELDDATILWRNADIEQERRIAIFDLIEENSFKPLRAFEAGFHGPYHLRLSVQDGRLVMDVSGEDGQLLETQDVYKRQVETGKIDRPDAPSGSPLPAAISGTSVPRSGKGLPQADAGIGGPATACLLYTSRCV